ncbi:MAG: response regulator [Magnetospiraceae bacterium]
MARQRKILVVEDSATVRELIGSALVEAGFWPIVAGTFEEALNIYDGSGAELVISDLIMPGMGGVAGIGLLRGKDPHVGIIAMSAGSSSADADTLLGSARQLGAHSILRKPFPKEKLLAAVETLLSRDFGKKSRQKRVFLIEDSRTVAKFIQQNLEKHGFALTWVTSVEEALANEEALMADVIISDIFLPGIGGIEGIQKIVKDWPHIPVVAISGGMGVDKHRTDALKAARVVGAAAALSKPFTEQQLVDTLNSVLSAPV